jgi:hypothetical protein
MSTTSLHTTDTSCGLVRLLQPLVRLVRQVTMVIASSALVLTSCTATIPSPGLLPTEPPPEQGAQDEVGDAPSSDAPDDASSSGGAWPSACYNAVPPSPC